MNRVEAGQSSEVLGNLVDRKFKAHAEHISDYTAITGEHFETLHLGLAYLRRKILEDGTRVDPCIDVNRTSFSPGLAMAWNEAIIRNEKGEWVYVFGDGDEEVGIEETHRPGDKVGALTKVKYLAKVLLGRPVFHNGIEDYGSEEEF